LEEIFLAFLVSSFTGIFLALLVSSLEETLVAVSPDNFSQGIGSNFNLDK
jgi:hypothetical protein